MDDIFRLGEKLLALCKSEENKCAEVEELLRSLSQDQRQAVLRHSYGDVSKPADHRFNGCDTAWAAYNLFVAMLSYYS